jgi:hypothetical protein
MALPLNIDRLRLLYDFFSECPPFDKWNMPDSDLINFMITRSKDTAGFVRKSSNPKYKYDLAISTVCCGWFSRVAWVMCHEMLHVHQMEAKMESPHTTHNQAFMKLGKKICAVFGFDPHEFC